MPYFTVMAAMNTEGLTSGNLYDIDRDDERLERWLRDGVVILREVHDDDA